MPAVPWDGRVSMFQHHWRELVKALTMQHLLFAIQIFLCPKSQLTVSIRSIWAIFWNEMCSPNKQRLVLQGEFCENFDRASAFDGFPVGGCRRQRNSCHGDNCQNVLHYVYGGFCLRRDFGPGFAFPDLTRLHSTGLPVLLAAGLQG